jgi:hypothetical protein
MLMAAASGIDDLPESAAPELAIARRHEARREEWNEHINFAEMLERYRDPTCTFWTSLENKPLSPLSGVFQKKRGVKSGLPDVLVISNGKTVFVELKSRRGVASKVQKERRLEMLPAGADWWMARSARAAMMALHLSGVVFRCEWKPSRLEPWEGPFADPTQRLPQHPVVAAERAAARKRCRERKREREAAQLAEQYQAKNIDGGDAELMDTSWLALRQRARQDRSEPLRTRMPSSEAMVVTADRAEARPRLNKST